MLVILCTQKASKTYYFFGSRDDWLLLKLDQPMQVKQYIYLEPAIVFRDDSDQLQ